MFTPGTPRRSNFDDFLGGLFSRRSSFYAFLGGLFPRRISIVCLKRTSIVLCFVKKGGKPTSERQSLTRFCGSKILIFAARTMSARHYCILEISTTKVHIIWTVEFLEQILVTFKQLFWSWQKNKTKNNSNFGLSLSNQAKFENT